MRDITKNVEENEIQYTTRNIQRSISFPRLHFVLYLGKSITFETVYAAFCVGLIYSNLATKIFCDEWVSPTLKTIKQRYINSPFSLCLCCKSFIFFNFKIECDIFPKHFSLINSEISPQGEQMEGSVIPSPLPHPKPARHC